MAVHTLHSISTDGHREKRKKRKETQEIKRERKKPTLALSL
jgi:hypothetical protein